MSIKLKVRQFMAKLMFGELPEDRVQFGNQLQKTILSSLELESHPDFTEVETLKNLNGDDTGYVKVYRNSKLERVSMLSIDVASGMRYINIHIIPKAEIDLPRFNMEGMLTSKGSQLSLDLYSDIDPLLEFDKLMARAKGVSHSYDKARKDSSIAWQASRLPHMRAFCSPFFLLAYRIPADSLTTFSSAANEYLQHWLELYRNHKTLSDAERDEVISRRASVTKTIVEADPDRDMIVSTYGEALTEAIEAAMMP